MTFYKALLQNIILPIGDSFWGSTYLQYLEEWKTLDTKSETELKSIQDQKTSELLLYAKKHVPYYRNLNATSLADFPILTKSILREHKFDLVSSEFNIRNLDQHFSSGSSGTQSFTFMTKEHTFYLRALQTHWWNWSGYTIGDFLLQFGISQHRSFLKKMKDLFFRCTYIKAFGLSKHDLKQILRKASNKKNLFIAGYPSVINQLAKSQIESQTNLNVKGIICFGDKLFDSHAKNIHQAFGNNLQLIDTYGCAEGLLMACKHDLDYYYIMSPHVQLEIVDDDGNPVDDGKMGHVLVTCLTNRAMPLIRYKLGDLAIKLPKEKYPEKRLLNYPLLQKVIGRETDVIKTSKDITLNVHSFTGVLEYYQAIKQYKIIQHDLENIIVEYIIDPTHNFSNEQLEEIQNKLRSLTNHCLNIMLKEVEEIAPTRSGKPQIIESNLKDL